MYIESSIVEGSKCIIDAPGVLHLLHRMGDPCTAQAHPDVVFTKPFSVFLFLFEVNLAKHCNMKLICTQNGNTCLDVKNKPFDWLSKQCNNNNTLNNVGSQKQSLDSRSGVFALFFPKFCPSHCTKLVINARKPQGGGGKQQGGAPCHFGLARTLY